MAIAIWSARHRQHGTETIVLSSLMYLVALYLLVGGFSLLLVITGADVGYMPFWHEPWRLLFGLIF